MIANARVLVAGGTGFVGANLIKKLLGRDVRIRATYNSHAPIILDPTIEYIQSDLTRMEDCRQAVADMDYVFMCAANTSGAAQIWNHPLSHITPNVVMNTQMLQAAYEAGIKKYVFISSSVVYPPSGSRPVKEEDIFPGDPDEVYFASGWMKRYAEILCQTYAQKIKKNMPTVVIRPSNMYGPYDKYDFAVSHVTAAMIRRVIERHNPFEVWGTGDDVRDLIYIDDFIEGTLRAFETNQDYLVVNIAAGKAYSIKDVIATLLEVDGFTDADIRYDRTKPSTIPIRLIDTSLAHNLLGFQAATTLSEGLARTIRWYRENEIAARR